MTLAAPLDFGDLADGTAGTAAGDYQTLLANNGPRHVIVNGLRLGTNADAELIGTPSANADGDDTAGAPDDEDAISSFPVLMAGVTSNVTVTTTNTSATAAKLSVWVDFNNNGSFADAGEQVAVDAVVAVNAASVVVPVPVPAAAVTGVAVGFRVRLSHDAALTSLGAATDGEVEDHRVTILLPVDLGDWDGAGAATTTSASLLSNNLRLGATVDAETSVTPDADATADGADEDGVTIPAFITLSRSVTIPVSVLNNSGANAYLNAWIDFDGDGTFNNTVVSGNNGGERLVAVSTISSGASPSTQNITFTVPSGANTGTQRGARFRLTSQAVTTPTGIAGTGEVEDYVVEIIARQDFGDWNGSGAQTTTTSSSYNPSLYLGATIDTEIAPLPDANASSDDTTDDGSPDDEDGVLLPSTTSPGLSLTIPVTVFNNSGSTAYLSAWIDFNNDGTFQDTLITSGGERLENVRSVSSSASATTQNITFTVPATASIGTLRGVRFRLTSNNNPGPTGRDGNGEVEDYTIEIQGVAVGDLVWNDLNGNGLKDTTEPGVAGLQLTLVNPGSDNAPGGIGPAADFFVANVNTGAGGLYLFAKLIPGKYYITFNPPVALPYATSASAADNQINNDSNGLQPGGPAAAVFSPVFDLMPAAESITDGDTDHDTDLTKDFGLMVTRQTLGDFVWADTNANGLQDSGEPGVNGVRVDLYLDNGDLISNPATDTLINTTTTVTIAGQAGRYTHVALDSGNYFSVFTPPDTWGITIANTGTDDAIDSDANATIISGQRVGISPVTELNIGENDLSWDAGLTDRSGIPAVWAIARQSNGMLVVGGRFKKSHGIPRNNICRVGTNGTLDTSFNPGAGFNGSVRSLAVLGDGSIVAGGSFTTFDGEPANGLAVISADGTRLISCAMPDQPAVKWVAYQGSQIYVGGQFATMGGVARNGFARLSSGGSSSWVCDTSFAAGSGANAVVHGGTFDAQGRLYLVGDFTSFNGTSCGRIARLTPQGLVDSTFNQGGVGANRRILSALATGGDQLFLTGEFTSFGGATFNGTVKLNLNGTVQPNYTPSALSPLESINTAD